MVVREQLHDAIKDAAAREDRKRLCTLRLMQTAIRDRDSAHCVGNGERISQAEIAGLLTKMIKQREEQAKNARDFGEPGEAEQTEREIETIREFMPPLMDEGELRSACEEVMSEIGAHSLRDVGRTMTVLKKRYPNQMDLGRASCLVKGMLR